MAIDRYQPLITGVTIILECYRVFTGTLLVVFVPGVCNGKRCLPTENFGKGDTVYRVGFVFNFLTLLCFINLYRVELMREHKFNHYLRIDHHAPTDSESVGKELVKLGEQRQQKILTINNEYQRVGAVTIVAVIINTAISIYVIVNGYLDDREPTVLATSTVLLATKLFDVFMAFNTDKNVLTSSYRRQKVQFNAVNPGKIVDTSKIVTEGPTMDTRKIVTEGPTMDTRKIEVAAAP
jgi:hypothetical protein